MTTPIVKLKALGPDGKEWSVSVCPKCRRTALTDQMAAECCESLVCACGADCARPWTLCEKCRGEKQANQEADRFKKAIKISAKDYDSWVYDDFTDKYFESVEGLFDQFADDEQPLPEYVYACKEIPLEIDATPVIENALEEHHEDAFERISSKERTRLQKILDAWCKDQGVISYAPDFSRVVVLGGGK